MSGGPSASSSGLAIGNDTPGGLELKKNESSRNRRFRPETPRILADETGRNLISVIEAVDLWQIGKLLIHVFILKSGTYSSVKKVRAINHIGKHDLDYDTPSVEDVVLPCTHPET